MIVYEHKVNYYETDKMSFTHHSNYIRFMEEARLYLMEQIGWGYDKMEAEGIISPVTSVSCEYKKSTTYPEVIRILPRVKDVTQVRLTMGYEMYVGEYLVCTAESKHCFLNKEGRPISLKRQYPAFYQVLEELKAEQEEGKKP